jgi:predicted alpha/beta superfamily hydrolase
MRILRTTWFKPGAVLALMIVACSTAPGGATTVISAGEQVTLHSELLGEDRTIFIGLPGSYGSGAERYPVLYLTDAQFNFAHLHTTAEFLARTAGIIPEIIVVGVANRDRTHDLYATRADFKQEDRVIPFPNSGNADQFLEFITKELIPWVEKSYRTSDLRILAGVSAGGNFALHAARVKPAVFQAVMVASPWLAWDDRRELKQLVPFLTSKQMQLKALFLTYAAEGASMKADIDAVAAALKSRSDTSLRWESRSYPDETHDSTALKSYYDGLRMIFAGYDYPRDPKTYRLIGSLDDLKAHYAKLGHRLGTSLSSPEWVVNELGYQYLRTGSSGPAIAAFRFNIEQHPESANAWDSLGEGLERIGEATEALASYRKAVALAEAQHTSNLESFRKHLSSLAATQR